MAIFGDLLWPLAISAYFLGAEHAEASTRWPTFELNKLSSAQLCSNVLGQVRQSLKKSPTDKSGVLGRPKAAAIVIRRPLEQDRERIVQSGTG